MPKSQSFKGVPTVRLPMLQCMAHISDYIGSTGWSWLVLTKEDSSLEGGGGFTTHHTLTFAVRTWRLLLFLSLSAQTLWSPLPPRPELGMLIAWRRSAPLTWNTSFLVAGGTEAFLSDSCNFRASKQVLETRKHKYILISCFFGSYLCCE